MGSNWSYILVLGTALIYLTVAFIQFRRVWLMQLRVKQLTLKGVRAKGKILSYARNKYVEIEFVNHSNSRVITDFKLDKNIKKLPVGSEITVLMGNEPHNSPAIVVEYDGKPIFTSIKKYMIFGVTLTLISILLAAMLLFVSTEDLLLRYAGILIPVIAAIAIFMAVTEDEMAQNRMRNMLLLYGLTATARIRKANSTGIVLHGCKQISFFLAYLDKDGKARFGKAEEPLETKDYLYFKQEKKVNILYHPHANKTRCLLNYTWQ